MGESSKSGSARVESSNRLLYSRTLINVRASSSEESFSQLDLQQRELQSQIEGTWNIENLFLLNDDEHDSKGKITFFNDGTYSLTEGSLIAAGLGSREDSKHGCVQTKDSQKWTAITDSYFVISHSSRMRYLQEAESTSNYLDFNVPVTLRYVSPDKIILSGSGGCGHSGTDRISILTKAQPE